MTQRIEFDTALKKNIKNFVLIIQNEAVACQLYEVPKSLDCGKSTATFYNASGATSAPEKGETPNKKAKLPVCLYSPHAEKGIRHIIRDYRACLGDEKKGYLAAFKNCRAEKGKKGANRVVDFLPQCGKKNSVVFSANFGRKMHGKLFTDVGADANLADDTLVQQIQLGGRAVDVQNFGPTSCGFSCCRSST